jgi:hypothetical protein
LRLTELEHQEFSAAAKCLGDSRADLLRQAVREIINRPADLLEKELAGLDEAVYQLRAVGRNLNQITRAMHLGELKDGQINGALLDELKQTVEQLANRINELAEKSRLRGVFR